MERSDIMSMVYYRIIPIIMTIFSFVIFFIVFATIISSFAKMNKRKGTVINNPAWKTVEKNNTEMNHQQHYDYSRAYSKANSAKADNGIKDKPLSEAERNVLYGK